MPANGLGSASEFEIMRIAMLGWEFPPFVSGGLGVHCFELTRALCKKGVKIDFFMPTSGVDIAPSCAGLRIIDIGKTALSPYLSFPKLRGKKSGGALGYGESLMGAVNEYAYWCSEAVCRENGKEKYDLLHTHDWLTSRAGALAKERLGLPLVQTFHSTEFDRTSSPWDAVVGIERAAVRNAGLLIAVSNRTKAQLMRLGAEDKKIRVIYNGVDSAKFASAKIDAETLLRIRKKRKIVLFLGRLTEQKGPVQFVQAAKKVLSIEPDTVFLIAGRGELLPHLINMTLELGISDKVRFLGYVPEEDQQRTYKIADVYVMPSTSEPFGITALEAMSSGVPVIISKTSGVAEIAKSAIRVDFWDINAMAQKIIAVLRYRPLSSTMTRISRMEAGAYTWERTADETLNVYREALAMRR